MYDINKRKHLVDMSVEQMIEELSKLPKDATVICGGTVDVWLHVAEDGSVLNIDYDDLEELYPLDE